MFKIILLFQAVLILTANQQTTEDPNSPTIEDVPCAVCQCYKIKCSRLETPDLQCVDEFRDSCDNPEDITETDDCNIKCDCCLEGKCYNWLTYYCFIYRSFEIFSVIYFLLFSVHFFSLWRLKKHLFTVKKKWKLKTKNRFKNKKTDDKKYFFKYKKFVWIKRHPDIFKKNMNEENVKHVL